MKSFSWIGIDISGKSRRGIIGCSSDVELKQILLKDGIALIKFSSKSKKKRDFWDFLGRGINSKDGIYFFSSLSMLLGSGEVLLSSLKIILYHTKSRNFKLVIDALISDLNHGLSFANALEKHPQIFNPLVVSMIASGEGSGQLGVVCEQVEKHLQDSLDIKKKLKGAALLPTITLFFAFLIVSLILVFIIPRFVILFSDLEQPIPPLTRFVFKMSLFVRSWKMIVLTLGFLVLYVAFKFSFKSFVFKKIKDRLILRIYFVRRISLLFNLIFFLQALIMQLSCGVKLLSAIQRACLVVSNSILAEKIKLVASSLDKGESLAKSMELEGDEYFPTELVAVVSIGEKSGRLKEMLQKILILFQRDLQAKINFAMSIFQPVLIILVGCIIAFILIAVYMPIFNLASTV